MDEQWGKEHEGQCGTCHYWTKEEEGYSCMCFTSPFAADWTDSDDSCGSYSPKRKVVNR